MSSQTQLIYQCVASKCTIAPPPSNVATELPTFVKRILNFNKYCNERHLVITHVYFNTRASTATRNCSGNTAA